MSFIKNHLLLYLSASVVLLANCAHTKVGTPELNNIYEEAAKQSDLYRNPVIVIPGILGSKLFDQEAQQVVWGVYDNQFTGPNTPSSMRQVALPMEYGKTLRQLKDSTISTGALDRLKLKLAGIPIEPRAYSSILATLGVGGYKDQELGLSGAIDYGDDHFTCFQFHYDWRRSNVENAAKLDAFIKQKKRYIRTQFKEKYGVDKKDIKFDIVSHSMGGLVARYYLRYGNQPLPQNGSLPQLNWSGAKDVEKLILVGTPSNGSILSFEQALEGQDFAPKWARAIPFTNIPSYPASVIGTYPSIYELLPRTRHNACVDTNGKSVDIFDAELWAQQKWGLLADDSLVHLQWLMPDATSDEQRKSIALNHIKKCLASAKQFHRAIDRPSTKPDDLSITIISGDAIQTKERIKIDLSDGSFEDNHYSHGDGVVLRSSVLADQRAGSTYSSRMQSSIDYDQVLFLPKNHLDLTKDTTFADNVLHILLEE